MDGAEVAAKEREVHGRGDNGQQREELERGGGKDEGEELRVEAGERLHACVRGCGLRCVGRAGTAVELCATTGRREGACGHESGGALDGEWCILQL